MDVIRNYELVGCRDFNKAGKGNVFIEKTTCVVVDYPFNFYTPFRGGFKPPPLNYWLLVKIRGKENEIRV